MPTPSEHLKRIQQFAAQQGGDEWRFVNAGLKSFFLDGVSLDIAFGVADERGRPRSHSDRIGMRDALIRQLYAEHFSSLGRPAAVREMNREYQHFLRVEGEDTKKLDEMPAHYAGKRWEVYWKIARLGVPFPRERRGVDILA